MEETRYSIVISLFDHNAALSLPRTTSPSALLPSTSTGLPAATQEALRLNSAKLVLPSHFWNPLPATAPLPTLPSTLPISPPASPKESQVSNAGIAGTRTTIPSNGISSENRGAYIPSIRTAELYVPSRQDVEKQVAQLDFRFGPLFVDWIERPRAMNSTTAGSDSSLPSTSALPPSSTSGNEGRSGRTALNWGIIHLYREAGVSPTPSTPTEKTRAQAEDDGTIVAVILVPGNISVAAFLEFISPALDGVMHLRMLRDSSPNRNLVIIRFKKASEADQFRRMYMGKAFSDSAQSELCQVVPISSVKLKSSSTPPFSFPYTTGNESTSEVVELPNCPICLERLDASISGLITVSCGHVHHCACLLRWGDSRCPVCRSTSSRARKPVLSATACSICRSESNLWQCLICGNLGCGRYQGGHSHSHYDESHHAYALEIKTQRIWSYEDDMYIHRLIRDNTDGRLVELPSLSSTLTTSAKDDATDSTEGGIGIAGGGGVKKGPDAKEEESMSKLEAYSIEIADVLTVQLDSQREFYQDEIEVLKRKWEESKGENLVVSEARGENERRIKELMGELEKERERWKKEKEVSTKVAIEEESRRKKERVEAVKSRRELEKALEEEKAVTASLTANLSHLRIEVGKRDQETAQVRAEVDDLREQMRDVMFALSARDSIAAQGGASEMAGGSVSVPPPPPPPVPTPSRRKKKH